jgi:small GTP-binding protein
MENNTTCKVVLVGNAGVGKTCIIERYIHDTYNPESETTITSSNNYKVVNFDEYNQSISFDIWGTAGQEVYRALAKNFYLNA